MALPQEEPTGDDATTEASPDELVDEFGTYRTAERPWTMNEIRDHPLFMEDMPSDISENPHLLALQSIVYDDQTPEQLAEHFRNLGNEAFRASTNKIASQNALMAYTRGLEMECKDNHLNSQLHSNRAAVSLRVQEYSKAVDDCRKSISLDAANLKAYFRATKASEALGLTQQALAFCDEALEHNDDAGEIRQLRGNLLKRLAKEEEARQSVKRDEVVVRQKRNLANDAVVVALSARNLKLGPMMYDVGMYAASGQKPMPVLTDSVETVCWPLLVLYDEVNQSDFVASFDESYSLDEQLQVMFPPDRRVEWDEEGKYVWDRLVVHLEFYPEEGSATQMEVVSTTKPLRMALSEKTVSPCLVLHVLVTGSKAHAFFCQEHGLS